MIGLLVLDTAAVAPAERLEALNQAFTTVSMPTQVGRAASGGEVSARIEIWQLGSGVLFTAHSSGIRLSRDQARVRRSSPTNLVVSAQSSGRAFLGQAGRRQAIGPGSLMLVDQRYPYEFGWLEPGRSLSYQVNLDELGVPATSLRHAAGHLHTSPFFSIFRSHLGQLTAAADQLTDGHAAATAGTVTTELMRALLTTTAGADPEPVPPEAEITRILAYARQHLHDRGLCAERIACAMNISLRHLYTLCRAADISLEQWVIQHRLELARATRHADRTGAHHCRDRPRLRIHRSRPLQPTVPPDLRGHPASMAGTSPHRRLPQAHDIERPDARRQRRLRPAGLVLVGREQPAQSLARRHPRPVRLLP